MIFENVQEKYVEEALVIAREEYKEECLKCPDLVNGSFEEELRDLLKELFKDGLGKVALEDGKVTGYLAFFGPWDGFFGNVKGVFSPLGGNGFNGKDRGRLASKLFQAVSEQLVQESVCSYALSRYAHDEEVGKSFVLNGFGIRCSDAIMKLSHRSIQQVGIPRVSYMELLGDQKKEIAELERGLTKHLSSSPIFFPTNLEEYHSELEKSDIRIIVAKKEEQVIGYIKLKKGAETFVTEHQEMYSICGAFVKEEYRGQRIAGQLLEYVCQMIEQEDIVYLGVDCETLNPTALRFWGKYFSAYTYSYIRRIDERVIGYDKYLKGYYSKNF